MGSMLKAELRENPPSVGELRAGNDQVEITMGASLTTDERVDTPASIKPDGDTRSLEMVQHFEDVFAGHHDLSIERGTEAGFFGVLVRQTVIWRTWRAILIGAGLSII